MSAARGAACRKEECREERERCRLLGCEKAHGLVKLVAQLFDALNLSVNIAHSIPGGEQQPGAGRLDERSTATDMDMLA
jgi:hypothetical protein